MCVNNPTSTILLFNSDVENVSSNGYVRRQLEVIVLGGGLHASAKVDGYIV